MQVNTVIAQLWAWLYGSNLTYKKTVVNGQTIETGLKRDEVEGIVRDLIPAIIDQIVTPFDWDFTFDVATVSSVASTSEYTLRGNNDDCRDLINVRYGSGRGVVIERLETLETDRREGEDEDTTTTGNVYGYTVFGRSSDGFPIIQLFDTPTEADTITYRYRKSNLTLDNIPGEFGFVVRDYLRAEFRPEWSGVAEKRLDEMIARYSVGGDEINKVRMSPDIEAGNIRRVENQGGC